MKDLRYQLFDDRLSVLMEGEEIAKALYSKSDTSWTIDYVFVGPAYRGRRIGKVLVEKLVEEGKNKGVELIPICSYAKKLFERNPHLKN